MKLHSMLLAGATLLAATGAQAQIFSADFNDYRNGSSAAQQSTTGLTVFAFGDLPGFTAGGEHAVHAVDRGNGDFAPMFYNGDSPDLSQSNFITSGLIAANAAGQLYTLSFDGAIGSYSNGVQQTQPGDTLLITLSDDNGPVASFSYAASSYTYTRFSSLYIGTGTGDVRLTVRGQGNAGQFGGSLDNLSIAAVPEPATWATMVLGFGLAGAALRRRAKATLRPAHA